MTVMVKANRSSEFIKDMGSGHYYTDTTTQKKYTHRSNWTGTKNMRKHSDLAKEHDHMVFWRKLSKKL